MSGKIICKVMICFLLCLGSRGDAREPFEVRRAKHQDPINVLYLFAKHQGIETDTDAFRQATKDVSDSRDLYTMLSVSRGLGCKSRLTKLTVAELASTSFPSCILLAGEGTSEGKWNLLSYVAPDHVAIVRGETMIVEQIPISDFRSQWNGYAIVPRDTPSESKLALRFGSLIVSFGIFIHFFQEGLAKCLKIILRGAGVSRSSRTLLEAK